MDRFQRIGVVGTGIMGSGIVQTCAQAGYATVIVGLQPELVSGAMVVIEKALSRLVDRGQLSQQAESEARDRIEATTDLNAVAACDLVIEAVVEDLEAKKDVFRRLDGICPPDTVLASDTATLPILELAMATGRPGKVVGLHILSPAPSSKAVEVVRSELSSPETVERATAFSQSLGKTVVVVNDSPGFVINRLLAPYLLEAVRLVEQGVASEEDIDSCMSLGCGHPVGPLRLLDLVGLDQFSDLAGSLHRQLGDPKYQVPHLLKEKVRRGELGRKSGQGFYRWS